MLKVRVLVPLLWSILFVQVAMAFPGNKLKSLYKEGINCRQEGRLEDAGRCFREVLHRDSTYSAAWLQLAEICALEEDYQESVSCYQHYLRLDERQPDAWYTLGVLHFNFKDFPAAANAFERAAAYGYTTDADYYLHLGTAYLHTRETEKALKHLRTSLIIREDDPRPMQALAHHYYLSGDFISAILYWNKLLSIQPENAFALFMLGKSYIGKGEKEKGEALCDKALAVLQ